MGSFCTSSPSVQTTNQTQTYAPNPAISKAGTKALKMATTAAESPFQMPAAPVAGFTPFQEQAFGQYADIQGGLEPYFNEATGELSRAAQPITADETASYLNPFAQGALANMKKYIFDPQRRDTMGNAAQRSGGYGAERLALTSQNLDKTQADALTQAYAGFYLPAQQQAQRAKEMALQSAQGWANLGLGRQSGELQATGALAGAGATQQQQQQNVLMSPYQQRLAQIAYPFQTSQFLAGITGGLSPALGGTTTGYGTTTAQPSQPSMFNQIAGLGMTAAGLAGGFGWNPFGSGGGGGGYIPTNSSYLNANYAPFGATYFKRGGSISPYDYAEGGSVEPEYEGEGFQFGGFPDDTFSPRFDSLPEEDPVGSRFGDSFVSDTGQTNPLDANTLRSYGLSRIQAGQEPTDALPVRAVPTESIRPVQQKPQITVNPMRPPVHAQTDDLPVKPGSPFGSRTRPDPSINGETTQDGLFAPRSALPYPDSRDRTWGDALTRSPWMSLVSAGAKMMQSTKSGLGGLGEGLEAGTKTLAEQRKELRTDEAVNLKAEELIRKANRDLASERLAAERIAQGKYSWSSGTGPGDDGLPTTGVYRLPTKGDEEPKFYPGRSLTGRGSAGRLSTYEVKKQDWLRLNPGDEQGAIDFASGRRTMTEAQMANAAAMRAQQDANNNPMLFNSENREDYLKQRIQYWLDFYRQNNSIR